jgi:hypothetical protein
MPQLQSTKVAVVAGTGSSANLVASSTGKSIHVWQLLVTGTTTDTVSIVFTQAGTATTIKVAVTNGTIVLPYTGAPWAIADVGTGITFTAAATTTLSAYYTIGIGG